jgi:RimJ/RimL family protein N-acetyltransferase
VEAASAVLRYAEQELQLRRVVAITNPDNDGSIAVLERIGLRFEKMVKLSDESSELKLFSTVRPL